MRRRSVEEDDDEEPPAAAVAAALDDVALDPAAPAANAAGDEAEGAAVAFAPAFAFAALLLLLLCTPCRLHCSMHRTGLPASMIVGASSSSDDGSIAPAGTAAWDAIREGEREGRGGADWSREQLFLLLFSGAIFDPELTRSTHNSSEQSMAQTIEKIHSKMRCLLRGFCWVSADKSGFLARCACCVHASEAATNTSASQAVDSPHSSTLSRRSKAAAGQRPASELACVAAVFTSLCPSGSSTFELLKDHENGNAT
jgi:hypothetical protein